jgi:phage baseplate assembly protein W
MIGMNRHTGRRIDGIEHLAMRINDVLTTFINTRIMRRRYGSDIINLMDAPINQQTIVDFYAGIADAFLNPINGLTDVELIKVKATSATAGRLEVYIEARWLPTGEPIKLHNMIIT